jgi:hypothetical protein
MFDRLKHYLFGNPNRSRSSRLTIAPSLFMTMRWWKR